MPEALRVGLIGAGFAAGLHADAWRRVSGVDVTLYGVAAAHRERSVSFAADHAIEHAFSDVHELLSDPAVTVVDICAPNHLHAPIALAALDAGRDIVVEKPFTGCFDPPSTATPTEMLARTLATTDAVLEKAAALGKVVCYAENWIYAPPVQKLARLLAASGGTILRIRGEESHSGTHAVANHRWVSAGGGSLLGKGCHPLGAALWLKAEEGRRRTGRAVRPRSVIAETARLTQVASFRSEEPKYLRTGYVDVEDWGHLVVRFDDDTVAEIAAADTTLGGVRNQLTVFSSRAVVEANLNPNTALRAFAPDPDVFGEEYLTEKLETKAGWSYPSPDESWMQGYPQEMQDFAEALVNRTPPKCGGALARDVVEVIYAAYESAGDGRRVTLPGRPDPRS